MKTQSKVSLYIIFGGIVFNVLIELIYNLEFKSKQLSIFLLIESATTVFLITGVNLIFILLILGIARILRKKLTSFIIPSLVITILTFLVILLAAIDQYRENEGRYGENSKMLYSIRTAEAKEKVLSQITYQLPYVSKKKIKDGKVIEDKIEAQEFLGEPYVYKILRLTTMKPILRKYIGDRVVEEKQLAILNKTNQGNIYLADVSQAGNVFLISIFPKQQTVAISMQYWWSYEDVVILWQGFGLYK